MNYSQLTINKDNFKHNYTFFRSKLSPSTKLLILVKANAYGHGDIECSKLLEEFGADYLGVATPEEGKRLKIAGIKLPIIILTPGNNNFEEIITHALEPSIVDFDGAYSFLKSLTESGKKRYPVHIKFDTGMHRVGFVKNEIKELTQFLNSNSSIEVKSVFSHLAAADEPSHDDFTRSQIELYSDMYEELALSIGYRPIRHILNSSGTERFTHAQMDMVRVGVGIYGTSYVDESKLKPVGYLQAPIIHIREISEGTVGYGRHGKLEGRTKMIATIPLGYADGINRHLGRGAASFSLNGTRVSTIGNICMDALMLDITGVDAKVGDIVTVFGENPTATELAHILKTISYEVFTSVAARVKRVVG
ncbi:MAG: alanine racemase [Rikenellaceae bacterium]|nr:alanine racemase [Rikenellaceae bacterium]